MAFFGHEMPAVGNDDAGQVGGGVAQRDQRRVPGRVFRADGQRGHAQAGLRALLVLPDGLGNGPIVGKAAA
ncbi:hypothetical protein G6F52_014197 [Rhizopus delemar]|nr:hypothetical protein G6F52_014197 [Rhizopus delemar]